MAPDTLLTRPCGLECAHLGGMAGSWAESAFVEHTQLTHAGTEVLRAGWPDYLLRRPDGAHIGVEVKARTDKVSKRQAECFAMLEAIGLPVFVWNPANPHELVPWRQYRPLPAIRKPRSPREPMPLTPPPAAVMSMLERLAANEVDAAVAPKAEPEFPPHRTTGAWQRLIGTKPMTPKSYQPTQPKRLGYSLKLRLR